MTTRSSADYKSEVRQSLRDKGPHRPTKHLKEKKEYQYDLKLFLERVFPEKFYRPFSEDQKVFIAEIQQVILEGGQEAIAMPRGEGKTTIIQCAVIWAVSYGHRRYVVVVGADQRAANKVLSAIQTTYETSARLNELFPELCFYIRALQGLAQRAAGQLCNGQPTNISWKTDQVIMPYVEMNAELLELARGSIIEARGLTGGKRGLQITTANGEVIRPDFVFLDDPQTRESAKSPEQCDDREDIIKTDLAGLAGVGIELAMLGAFTVIALDDLADRMLNQWRSIRSKALYEFPESHSTLWAEYIELRRSARKAGNEKRVCNDFYKANREEMDAGAKVGNEHRKNRGELSALQNIYNYISDNGISSFYSELQNDPQGNTSKFYTITPSIITTKINGHDRNIIPNDCHYVNAGIDVNYYALNWAVGAVQNDMTAYFMDYGRYPKGSALWSPDDNRTAEVAIYEGIYELASTLVQRQPGLKLIAVDGNYATDTIYRVCSALNKVLKCHVIVFRGVGSEKYSLPENKKTLIRKGAECHLSKSVSRGENVIFNSHYWQVYLQKSFLLSPGSPGSCSFWGNESEDHRTIADHICADRLQEIEYKAGRELMKFTKRPGERNDLSDAAKMCLVGASVFGAEIGVAKEIEQPKRQAPARRSPIKFMQI